MPTPISKRSHVALPLTIGAALLFAVLLVLVTPAPLSAQDEGYDLLPDGEAKDLVFAVCSGCHSIRLVVQQGLPRKRWDKLLDWMVEEQGMAELDPESRQQVLDYLEEHLNIDHRPPPPMGQAQN